MGADEYTLLRTRRRKAIIVLIIGLALLITSMYLSFKIIVGAPYLKELSQSVSVDDYFFIAMPKEVRNNAWVSSKVDVILHIKSNGRLSNVLVYAIDIYENETKIGDIINVEPNRTYLVMNKSFDVGFFRSLVGFELRFQKVSAEGLSIDYFMRIKGRVQPYPLIFNYVLLFLTLIGFIAAIVGFIELVRTHARIKYYYEV